MDVKSSSSNTREGWVRKCLYFFNLNRVSYSGTLCMLIPRTCSMRCHREHSVISGLSLSVVLLFVLFFSLVFFRELQFSSLCKKNFLQNPSATGLSVSRIVRTVLYLVPLMAKLNNSSFLLTKFWYQNKGINSWELTWVNRFQSSEKLCKHSWNFIITVHQFMNVSYKVNICFRRLMLLEMIPFYIDN